MLRSQELYGTPYTELAAVPWGWEIYHTKTSDKPEFQHDSIPEMDQTQEKSYAASQEWSYKSLVPGAGGGLTGGLSC